MSNSIFPAFDGLSLQAESTTDVSVEGMVTINAIYTGALDVINSLSWKTGTPHPGFAYVGIDTFRITAKKGPWGAIELRYKGAFAFGQPWYTQQKSLCTIPVDQASNFTKVAGTPSSPKNGAKFDGDGIFIGWGVVNPGQDPSIVSPYQGRLNLDATKITVTELSITSSPKAGPDINGQPTSAPGPYPIGKCIFMGASNTQIGGVCYRNVLTWQNIPTAQIPLVE